MEKEQIREEKAKQYEHKLEARRHSSLHIVAFLLGIFAVIGHLFWYVGIPAGVLAIVFGAKAVRRTASKLAKAGLILGIIGLSMTVFAYVSIILISLLSTLYNVL